MTRLIHPRNSFRLSRRGLIKAGLATATVLASPWVWRRPANAAGQVIVRNPGGAYEETMRRAVYDPFTKKTGIEVIPVAATFAKLAAMFKAGNVELDVIDIGDGTLLKLHRQGALAPIEYGGFRYTNPDDIDPAYKRDYLVGNFVYATVLGYNKEAFPGGKHPRSWAEFWDAKSFPGPRMLADIASGQPNLEFALLADGVSMDKIYPMDLDRAFASLSRIKPHITKFWDSGALSAQMMADKEVIAGSIWSGRIQTVIDKGAPLAIEWNQNMIQMQAYGIFKDAKNFENAQKLVDFATSPEAGAHFAKELRYGPSNRKAYELIDPALIDILPGGPKYRDMGFVQSVGYWEDNREEINRRWSRWVIRG